MYTYTGVKTRFQCQMMFASLNSKDGYHTRSRNC